MKTFLALFLLAAAPALAQTAETPESAADAAVSEPALRADLLARVAADQDARRRLVEAGAFHPDSLADPSPAVAALLAEMMATDAENLAFVVARVDAAGWPTAAEVGRDGVGAAFLVVQHADPATQERMLPLVEASWRAGDLDGPSYALLLDRVRVARGEPQVYGTQPAQTADGAFVIEGTVDDATLDARRAEVGLPPVAEYLALLAEVYRAPAE